MATQPEPDDTFEPAAPHGDEVMEQLVVLMGDVLEAMIAFVNRLDRIEAVLAGVEQDDANVH
jgi:hypothetical protein